MTARARTSPTPVASTLVDPQRGLAGRRATKLANLHLVDSRLHRKSDRRRALRVAGRKSTDDSIDDEIAARRRDFELIGR